VHNRHSQDPIILVDQNATISYWNPAAEKTFGYTVEEAVGRCIHELVIPNTLCQEAKDRIELGVKIFAEAGMGYYTVGNVELVGRRKNGSEFPVELSIFPIMISGKWSAVGVVTDITERKRDRQKLRDQEQRCQVLFNQAPGCCNCDPDTMVLLNSTICDKTIGVLSEDLVFSIAEIEAKETPETSSCILLK
jgi:PAS domain S-box-containing protein